MERINIMGKFPYGRDGRGTPYGTIPRALAEAAFEIYAKYLGGSGQSLETLSRRGGFSHGEMDLMVSHPEYQGNQNWREEFEANENMREFLPDLKWPPEGFKPPKYSDPSGMYPWLSK